MNTRERMKFEKRHEGTIIYAIPTGNNARISTAGAIEKFRVSSVKRKYVYLQRMLSDGRFNNDSRPYSPVTGATAEAIKAGYTNNAGYIFFESQEDLERYKEIGRMRGEIGKVFRFINMLVDDDKIEKIHAILTEDNDSKIMEVING